MASLSLAEGVLMNVSVDPSTDNQYAIRFAEDLDTVRVLLAHQRADPIAQYYEVIERAKEASVRSYSFCCLVISYIMRVSIRWSSIMRLALLRGRKKIVQLLTDHNERKSAEEKWMTRGI
ncbi:hypothetical protein PROFUN_14176 [Planoprotostelium fungivorum]|uniref:Uncharacterized protein n=1 Tax=Planoprotostelium fungivorum TaxID=1890364 RepID=A0A2P6N0Q6_9EUKA|nr:hypothetical protein PROFUN_14176 [Planoprotostelium fungivorum]